MFNARRRGVWSGSLIGIFSLVALLVFAPRCFAADGEAHQAAANANEAVQASGGAVHQAVTDAAKTVQHAVKHEEATEGHGEEGRYGLTHGQIMNFIWHCLNFAILVILLVKWLRKPISDALNDRTESIRAAFEELDTKKAEAERKYAEYERKLSNMDEEAARILNNFIEQGKAEKEKIIAQAHDAAERIKAQAEFYVQQELAMAKAELKKEVSEMAIKMAEELIRKNLDEQDHHRLISEYLERVVQKN